MTRDESWKRQLARVNDAARDPGYRDCIARVLGEMYHLGGHVQIDERDDCTWLDCWDAGMLMYIGRDGERILRVRGDGGAFGELVRVAAEDPAA
jgi:hypothetical protein